MYDRAASIQSLALNAALALAVSFLMMAVRLLFTQPSPAGFTSMPAEWRFSRNRHQLVSSGGTTWARACCMGATKHWGGHGR